MGFVVRYGLRPADLSYTSAQARTDLHKDNTGWILLEDLKPDTTYYYQVESATGDTHDKMTGSFKTLPLADDFKGEHNPGGLFNFSFEFACGNSPQPTDPPRPAYVTMLREIKDQIDFSILNGDWLYERDREFSVEQWLDQNGLTAKQRPDFLKLAPAVTGVWQNYKGYLEEDGNALAPVAT